MIVMHYIITTWNESNTELGRKQHALKRNGFTYVLCWCFIAFSAAIHLKPFFFHWDHFSLFLFFLPLICFQAISVEFPPAWRGAEDRSYDGMLCQALLWDKPRRLWINRYIFLSVNDPLHHSTFKLKPLYVGTLTNLMA